MKGFGLDFFGGGLELGLGWGMSREAHVALMCNNLLKNWMEFSYWAQLQPIP